MAILLKRRGKEAQVPILGARSGAGAVRRAADHARAGATEEDSDIRPNTKRGNRDRQCAVVLVCCGSIVSVNLSAFAGSEGPSPPDRRPSSLTCP